MTITDLIPTSFLQIHILKPVVIKVLQLCLAVQLIFLTTINYCFSQKLENLITEVQKEKVIIRYDLIDDDPENKYDIQLFSSDNNYRSALALVTGDIGPEITAGKDKKITWDAKGELKRYNGNITFEIKVELNGGKISFNNPLSETTFKRGFPYQIKWHGGKANPDFEVQLYRNNVMQKSLGKSEGKKSFTWSIPVKNKPGNYQIKLLDKTTTVATSYNFRISRKLPLLLKVAPVLLVGAIAGVLAIGVNGGEKPPNSNIPDNNLPDAPGAPKGN